MSAKSRKKIIFSVDVESDPRDKYESITSALKNLKEISEKFNIKPVLFVTGDCIKHFPQTFKVLQKTGWEISSHSFSHKRFDTLSSKQKEEDIKKSIQIFKKHLGIRPRGFRAPQFSIDFETLKLLEKYGFEYDSSIVQCPLSQAIFFPSKFSTYLKNTKIPKLIKQKNIKIKEIPVSSFILPISMFTLRYFSVFAVKIMAYFSLLFRKDKTLMFLSHTYELKDQKLIKKLDKFLRSFCR